MIVGGDVRSLISKPKSKSLVTLTPTKSATLANLYDPLAMPPALAQAHAELDRAADLCYRPEKFESDRQRVEFLFALYEKLTAPLLPAAKSKKGPVQRAGPAILKG